MAEPTINKLRLKKSVHDLLWKRKNAMEAKFNVNMKKCGNYYLSEKHGPKIVFDNCSRNFTCVDIVSGGKSDFKALKKYVDEVFAKPEMICFVSYHHDLEPIFENAVWIDIFEEIFCVCISTKPDCELHISGTELSVTSAVTAFQELIAKYHECTNALVANRQKLAAALTACKDISVPGSSFKSIPDGVIQLLLSLLEKAYKQSYPICDESESSEHNVMAIDPPEKEITPVIVIDSDSSSESNSNHSLQSGSSGKVSKKNLCKGEMKEKRNRTLENVNSLQGGGDLPYESEISIAQRLRMYIFAGEELMIPKDPLGVCDESESSENSVMVIDPPEKKIAPVIVIDSDSSSESNSKHHLQSGSSGKVSKKKLCEGEIKEKRSHALESVNSLQGGGDFPDESEISTAQRLDMYLFAGEEMLRSFGPRLDEFLSFLAEK